MDCVGDGEGDEGLFSFRQSSFSEDGAIVGYEFLLQVLAALTHLGKLAQIMGMIIGLHWLLQIVNAKV